MHDVIMSNIFILMDRSKGCAYFYLYFRLLDIYLKANTMIIFFRVTIVTDFQFNNFLNLSTSLLFLITLQWPLSFSGHDWVSFSSYTISVTFKMVFSTYETSFSTPPWEPTLSLSYGHKSPYVASNFTCFYMLLSQHNLDPSILLVSGRDMVTTTHENLGRVVHSRTMNYYFWEDSHIP